MRVRRTATVEVKSNLRLIARERGKIAARREGHNIWLNLGREYLASLIAYAAYGPLTTERDDRIRYMGFGIGGNRQVALGVANSNPILTAYPGNNNQNDTTATVTALERPVRVSGSSSPYPGQGGDVWLGQVTAPAEHPVATQTLFRRLFTASEVSYSPFLSVPLSEIGLFTNAASPNVYNNTMVAYDTFDTLSKTAAFEIEVAWTIRF